MTRTKEKMVIVENPARIIIFLLSGLIFISLFIIFIYYLYRKKIINKFNLQ